MQLELKGIAASGSLRFALSHLVANGLECATATREMHARFARYLLDFFGDRQLDEIRYQDLRRYLDEEKRRGIARETIRKRLSTLHMALCEAVRQGWIDKIPPWPVIKSDSRPKEAFWTLAQWEAADAECDDEEFRTWIMCGWWMGSHSSDLDRLRWEDLDLAAGTWVRRNTKSKAKPAVLPLPAPLLKRLRARHDALTPHRRDLVSGRRMGHPNRPLKELCHRAGVPLLSPIGLRHSCITFLEERGTTELFQQTWIGLQSPAMLKRHYRHITKPTIERAMALLDPSSSN